MVKTTKQMTQPVEVVDYNPTWMDMFAAERDVLLGVTDDYFVALEHIGSTAVPGQSAKPVIDMMAAVHKLNDLDTLLPDLNQLGYRLRETGMRHRHFLRKQEARSGQVFHLHIVELSTWPERNERLMRDYLLAHPEAVVAYGELKSNLAKTYAENSVTYTKAKTDFIQEVVDKARASLGLPHVDVWED